MLATEALFYAIRSRLQATPLVVVVHDVDDNNQGLIHTESVNFAEIWAAFTRPSRYGRFKSENAKAILSKPDPVKEFLSRASNEFDYPTEYLTRRDYEERKREEERKRLEHAASDIAARHRVQPGTMEFLAAVEAEIQAADDAHSAWNDPETRMEHWAACMYSGAGRDAYFDDLNFENGRMESRADLAASVLEWCRKATPLLYAQYCEQMARQGNGA